MLSPSHINISKSKVETSPGTEVSAGVAEQSAQMLFDFVFAGVALPFSPGFVVYHKTMTQLLTEALACESRDLP